MNFELIIGDEKIGALQQALGARTWPEFMQHDSIVNKYWPDLYTNFLKFQFALFDKEEIVAVGNSVCLNWKWQFSELPDTGLDWAMDKADSDFQSGINPNILVGVQILINEKYQSGGISYKMLDIMKEVAGNNGLEAIALPLRPTLKCVYPLISIQHYVSWKNMEGLPFDPWIRVHIKAGGKIVGICNQSMHITGTIAEWEIWAGFEIPESGSYVVDKALVPVVIDRQKDIGTYMEPNVWVIHDVKS